MKVTEQIDAMEASAVDPYKYPGGDTYSGVRCDAATAHTCCGLLRHLSWLDHDHVDGADFASTLHRTWLQRSDLQRFSAADVQDRCFWADHWTGRLLSGDAGARGHRRRRARGDQRGGDLLALHHSRRRVAGPADPGVLPMTAPMKTKADAAPIQSKNSAQVFRQAESAERNRSGSRAKGETLSVLGRSGTGKSVLLKLIIGLQQPDSGSIRIHGQEITGLSRQQLNEIRKTMGFLFQNSALYDSLTVEQNVAFPLERAGGLSDAERKKRVRELLATVGMEKDLDKLPGQISGGMQKRVGLARALALSPDILLFDEPTAGLDPITASEIDALILKMQKETNLTSIVVTHDLPSARAVSDRLALMRDGEILIEGSFKDLQASKDEFVVQFLNRDS